MSPNIPIENWDIEAEPPATIAIIGAGPVGVEAALYARFLGYDVILIEKTKPAASLIAWGERSLTAPLDKLTSPLGRRALEAQNGEPFQPPKNMQTIASGSQWADCYVTPLVKSDLLADKIEAFTTVKDISRVRSQHQLEDLQDRCNDEFRLLLHSPKRGYWNARADIIIDCSGLQVIQGAGPGGGQAAGESELVNDIVYQLPRWLDKDKHDYSGKKIVLYGCSQLAQQSIRDFIDGIDFTEPSKLVWLIPQNANEILDSETNKTLEQIASQAQQSDQPIGSMRVLGIEKVEKVNEQLKLAIRQPDDTLLDYHANILISLPQLEPDYRMTTQIICNAQAQPNRMEQCERFETSEPHYYVVGSKLCHSDHSAQNSAAIYKQSLTDIQRLFALLGGRADLDLYNQTSV